MPVTIQWDNEEKSIVRMQYVGRWTWEELYAATTQSHTMLDEVDHKVDFIHDWLKSNAIPANAIVHSKNLIEKRHPNVGIVVLVWTNPVIKAMWTAFSSKVYANLTKRYTFWLTSSIEEARDKLTQFHAEEQLR
jgi:hypothetical protein